ncbi:MAG: SDR family NAD(P)-dependent oxidoreductase, partial [FCB group bacterium]
MKEQELFSLKNKTAIVTGALGLIGKQHCYALSEAGANIVVTDLNEKACSVFASKLPTQSIGITCDITNPESITNLLKKTIKEFGTIDILINNAAINDMVEHPTSSLSQSKFENYPLDLFKKVMDVNVNGIFLCCQIIGPELVKNGKGSIINIASTYSIVAPDQSLYQNKKGKQLFYKSVAYPTAKGAVISLTKYLAAYWGKTGVRVNALSPGGVENKQNKYFIKK